MRKLADGQAYSGRRPDRACLNFSMDREAVELLRSYATGKKLGEFVARLVHSHHARVLEREQWRRKLALVLNADEE